MFISVVVPAFNEEKYIGHCLSSLRAQSYPSELYEVIVVDNASTDRTSEIARGFGVRVIHEAERGIGRARHRGAEEARGEIIAGTDADAIAPPTWLEVIATAFGGDDALGLLTGPVVFHDGSCLERWFTRYVSSGMTRLLSALGRGVIMGTNFAVRARDYWRVGGFNTSLFSAEDIELGARLRAVTRTAFEPEMLMYASARRTHEGYVKVFARTARDYVRVVFLGIAPAGKDFVPIR